MWSSPTAGRLGWAPWPTPQRLLQGAPRWCDESDLRQHTDARIPIRPPDLPSSAGGVREGQGPASLRRRWPRVPRLRLRDRCRVTRTCASGSRRCNRGPGNTLLHTSNLYYHPFQAEAAARLAKLSGLSRAFFCNSGAEANEACLKFARRYWHTLGVKDRTGFVAIENAFAGRTMGALSVTWDEHYRTPFAPLLGPVTFVDPNSPESLYAAVSDKTAAIIAEPIRGEGGVRPLPRRSPTR